ncbi:ICOS ligand [Fundulus heteroclitus]|uniref:ICOS ligand n=1 Tax=Fundulus heteroclitus TaxID=8078 RepID=UPI00165C757B|nr:ICOS ligand [Fundulus heteroclitus]
MRRGAGRGSEAEPTYVVHVSTVSRTHGFGFSKLRRQAPMSSFWVLCALLRAKERAMAVALWRGAAILLCCVCSCASAEEDCVLGIVGKPVILPCLYSNLRTALNFSIEWRKNDTAVLRSLWDEDGNVETWSWNHAGIPRDAPFTKNFSLELPSARVKDDRSQFSLFLLSGENQSAPLCTQCLRVAASFSTPEVKKERSGEAYEWTYQCHSSGGYPKPAVYWLYNNSQEPPNGSVTTRAQLLRGSDLYNVTSWLTTHPSNDTTVSCVIENPVLNETLAFTYGASSGPVEWRPSQGMWIFSTVLSVLVAIMVIAGVCYQIKLDKISKRLKKEYQEEPQRGRRRRYKQTTETMMLEPEETDV